MIVPRDYAGQRQLWEQLSVVFSGNGTRPPGPEPTGCPTPWPEPTPWPQPTPWPEPTGCPTPWPEPTPWPQPTPWPEPTACPTPWPEPTPAPCSKGVGGVWQVVKLEDLRAWTRECFRDVEEVDFAAKIGAPGDSLWLPLKCWDFDFHLEGKYGVGIIGGYTLGVYIMDKDGNVEGNWIKQWQQGSKYCFLRVVSIARKTRPPAMWIFMGSPERVWSKFLVPGETAKVWVHLPMFSDSMEVTRSSWMLMWRTGCGDTDWVNYGYE